MAKRKKQEAVEDVGNIFDHFAKVGRPTPAPGQGLSEKQPVTSEALLARIDALEKQNNALQERREYPMLAPAAPQERRVGPGDMKLDLVTNMPDRDVDPEGWAREQQTRIAAFAQSQAQAARQEVEGRFEQRAAADRLWAGFASKYPGWAKYEPLVETVASRVANDAQGRGVDLQKYMFGSPELFYQDLDTALKASYGKLLEDADEELGDDGDDGEDEGATPMDGRTAGIHANVETPTRGKGEEKTKGGDMFDDLKAVQRAMGIY